MPTLSLRDSASVALANLPERFRQALLAKATVLAAELEARVQQKLAGEVLQSRSGVLARSIVSSIDQQDAGVAVSIASNGNVKYAAIHEFGGVIPAHQIMPDKAKALAFIIGGKQVFATRVNLPAVTMPERSYLRASLNELADQIRQGLSEAVRDVVG